MPSTSALATPTGHEVNASVGGYRYIEPGAQSISIRGVKVGGRSRGGVRRRISGLALMAVVSAYVVFADGDSKS
jgi:hypothetical protein